MEFTHVEEDVSKRGADDGSDAKVGEGPGGVFSRRAAAKVGAGDDEDLCASEGLLVEDEVGALRLLVVRVAVRVEERASQTGPLDRLQEAGGDDGVGVDVAGRGKQMDKNAAACSD